MLITMNMIAIMIKDVEFEAHIHPHPQYILASAGLSPAENRAYIFEAGDNAVCKNGVDYIVFPKCTKERALEYVQSIFDFYNHWEHQVMYLVRDGKWQEAVNSLDEFCKNPVALFDSNLAVLSMSERFGPGTVDEEWDFLLKFRISSRSAVQSGRGRARFMETLEDGPGVFFTPPEAPGLPGYLTISIRTNEKVCGYVSSVSTVCAFDNGEVEALAAFARLIAFLIHNITIETNENIIQRANAFEQYLQGIVDKKAFERRLSYLGWQPDESYIMYALIFDADSVKNDIIRARIAINNTTSLPCVTVDNMLIIIVNNTCTNKVFVTELLETLSAQYKARLVCSLTFNSAFHINHGLSQIRYIKDLPLPEGLTDFYGYAVDYILLSSEKEDLYYACHPGIIRLMSENPQKNLLYAQALKAYLVSNHSVSAAADKIGVHKNTLFYRIEKAIEIAGLDQNSEYDMLYALTSIRIIELLGKAEEGAIYC